MRGLHGKKKKGVVKVQKFKKTRTVHELLQLTS